MVDKNTDVKKTTTKKVAAKATTTKKQSVKKSAPKKSATIMTDTQSNASSTQNNMETLTTIKSIVDEMRQENISRDKHLTSMVQEIRQGFTTYSDHSVEQNSEREQEMTKLYQSLQNAFSNVENNDNEREDRSLLILQALSESIMKDHEQALKELEEQEKLQDKKLQHLSRVEKQRSGRNRWIAIPGVIIAVTAIIYMFYVVTVMETAMTSMSEDMHNIQFAVVNMSDKMDGMSQDTGSMNTNMQQLNGNIGQMSTDLNIMTHNVSPAMKGMRDIMPWSP